MIYRRKSDPKNRICKDFTGTAVGELSLPYTYKLQHQNRPALSIESRLSRALRFEEVGTPAGQAVICLNMGKNATIRISPATPRIELKFLVSRNIKFTITALSGGRQVANQTVSGLRSGVKSVVIDGCGIDRLIFEGKGIQLMKVC